MNITLYKMKKDRLIINKDIENNTTALPLMAYARGEFDIENPVITIDSDNASITQYNYVYIEEYNRYYFVTRRKCIRTGVYEFTCEEDYLTSWKNTIYSWTMQLERAQKAGNVNMYLNDGTLTQMAGNNFTQWPFIDSNGVVQKFPDEQYYYILTAGD